MKPDIHPKTNPVVFVDSSSGAEFVTTSTLSSEETRDIDGVAHFVIRVEISSASHPFFTGEERFVDTAGRVDKFKAKLERVEAAAQARKGKKAKKAKKAAEKAATEAAKSPKKEKKEAKAEKAPAPAEEKEEKTEVPAEAAPEAPTPEEPKAEEANTEA